MVITLRSYSGRRLIGDFTVTSVEAADIITAHEVANGNTVHRIVW